MTKTPALTTRSGLERFRRSVLPFPKAKVRSERRYRLYRLVARAGRAGGLDPVGRAAAAGGAVTADDLRVQLFDYIRDELDPEARLQGKRIVAFGNMLVLVTAARLASRGDDQSDNRDDDA